MRRILVIALCVVQLILIAPQAFAQTVQPSPIRTQVSPTPVQSGPTQRPNLTVTPTPFGPSEPPTTGVALTLSPTFLSLIADPGKPVTSQFKVTNNNNFREYLAIDIKRFTASATGDSPVIADLDADDPFPSWVAFSEQRFTIDANQTKTITVRLTPPADAALGYYYAFMITRVSERGDLQGAVVAGSPAMAVLLNVKSPNAKREIQLVDFTTDKFFYEYLPVTFKVKVKNTGNIHVVPVGDIFIDSMWKKQIAIVQMNKPKGNVLPQTSRTYDAIWADAFALRNAKIENGKEAKDDKGNTVYEMKYDFAKGDKFRFGKYTAHMLLVYDNGQRDVPIEARVSFWVIPWKMLLIAIGILLFALLGIVSTVVSNVRRLRRRQNSQ